MADEFNNVNLQAMTPDQLATFITKAGSRTVAPAEIADDVAQGAPVGAGGRINLVHYMAWMVRKIERNRA